MDVIDDSSSEKKLKDSRYYKHVLNSGFQQELKRLNCDVKKDKKVHYTYIYLDGKILNNLSDCKFVEFIESIIYIEKGKDDRMTQHAHPAKRQVRYLF